VGEVVRHGISQRRACVLLSVARSGLVYRDRRAGADAALLRAIQHLVRQHPRWGYRRVWAGLRRKGQVRNGKRVYRLWRRAGLPLPQRRGRRRRPAGARVAPVAGQPNAVWASDILHQACANGERVRCLTVVDEYTRECLAIVVAPRLSAEQVVRCWAPLVARYGPPQYLRTDNGPEFVSRRTQAWLALHQILPARIAPGHPWQNGVVESFHSRLRDECLDREWVASAAEAAVLLEQYRRRYNTEHLHSSQQYRTPAEVRAQSGTGGDRAFLPGSREPVPV
jgi:putative transposase